MSKSYKADQYDEIPKRFHSTPKSELSTRLDGYTNPCGKLDILRNFFYVMIEKVILKQLKFIFSVQNTATIKYPSEYNTIIIIFSCVVDFYSKLKTPYISNSL